MRPILPARSTPSIRPQARPVIPWTFRGLRASPSDVWRLLPAISVGLHDAMRDQAKTARTESDILDVTFSGALFRAAIVIGRPRWISAQSAEPIAASIRPT